jgi:hypothetical protein
MTVSSVPRKRGRPKGIKNAPKAEAAGLANEHYDIRKMPSDAIARVMEFYSGRLVQTLCDHSTDGEELAASVLTHVVFNKRKVTGLNRETAMTMLFQAFEHPDLLPMVLKGCYIENTLIMRASTEALRKASTALLPQSELPHARHISLLMKDMLRFRGEVIARYNPLIKTKASSFVWGRGTQGIIVENNDAAQNFTMAATRAVDKFLPTAGSLTTYVTLWLKDASNSGFTQPLAEAYRLSRSARKRIHTETVATGSAKTSNKSIPLEDMPLDSEVADSDHDSIVKDLGFLRIMQSSGKLNEVWTACAMVGVASELEMTA